MKLNNEFFIFITTIPSDLDLDLDQDDQGDLDVQSQDVTLMKDSAFQDVFEQAPQFSTFKRVWETKFK